MEHISRGLERIEQNIKLNTADPVALHGFTQLPNFILRNPDLSIGAKTADLNNKGVRGARKCGEEGCIC